MQYIQIHQYQLIKNQDQPGKSSSSKKLGVSIGDLLTQTGTFDLRSSTPYIDHLRIEEKKKEKKRNE